MTDPVSKWFRGAFTLAGSFFPAAMGSLLVASTFPLTGEPASVDGAHGWEVSDTVHGAPDHTGLPATAGRALRMRLNAGRAQAVLRQAPSERLHAEERRGVEWAVPMPNGELKWFRVTRTEVMHPQLAARYPGIRTYRGVGVEDSRDTLRLDLHGDRIHAQVRGPGGQAYIDPDPGSEGGVYRVYDPRTAFRSDDEGIECLTATDDETGPASSASAGDLQSDGVLRTFRLAVAATGEYTQFHGGTVESGLAAVVTAVNRLNGIYEAELAIRFQLVADNDQLIFTGPDTDPYSNLDAVAMLSENQATLDTRIGSGGYDVGHVFATGGGGLAQLYSVCVPGWKARGVTGRASPTGDSFHVDYFAHEIGHQFGAHHSFNGIEGSCSALNRHTSTAYEPGSGSTIMSYSGICGSDNLQYNSDPYFHAANLLEIRDHLRTIGGVPTSPAMALPTVDAGVDRVIPMGTPFELTAVGSDPDGAVLTYCWEQMDLGSARPLDGLDAGTGPLFRSSLPVAQPTRSFPGRTALLLNASDPAEVLPTTERTLHFRVTARKTGLAGGAFAMDDVQLSVTTAAGPFVVQWPNGGGQLSGEQTVLWDVADTDVAPVSTAFVDLLLSTNGGLDFPIRLAEHTPNDGAETVRLPALYASQARIKVRACDTVYFDMSDADFAVVPGVDSGLVLLTETNVFANSQPVLVPASGTMGNADLFPSPLVVDGLEGVVEEVRVRLNGLTHGFLDDLDVLLVGPGGQSVVLLSDGSGGAVANGLDLEFADNGATLPMNGVIASGTYQPVNVGSTGDAFPLPGPHGVQLSIFNDTDPNGVWSLYITDDSNWDSGQLVGGWSIHLRTARVVEETNQAPVLLPQPRRYVHAGSTLTVTNQAVDPDGAGDLTYALRPDAPPGAVLDPVGVLVWTPDGTLAGTTNYCGIRVTDSGTPAMTSEGGVEVVVAGPPVISSLVVTSESVTLRWSSVPGAVYAVEASDHPGLGGWSVLGAPVHAADFETETICPTTSGGRRFFRIRAEP